MCVCGLGGVDRNILYRRVNHEVDMVFYVLYPLPPDVLEKYICPMEHPASNSVKFAFVSGLHEGTINHEDKH